MTLSDGRTTAYQWDTGLKVATTDPAGTVRRFANEHGSKSLPVEAVDESGTVYYHIPNILLSTGYDVVMYTLGGNGDDNIYTNTEDVLPVFHAPKPDDYIFTDEEINLWKSLNDRVTTNENNIATNTANIAANTLAIGVNTNNIATNTGNIATNTANIGTNASAIAAINAAPHIYRFPLEENGGVLSTTATFAEVVAAFQRGDYIVTNAWGLELTMLTAEYTEPPDEDIYMTFTAPWSSGDGATIIGQGYVYCELHNGTWTFDSSADTLPQWLDPDITDYTNYGKVPVITSDGVEWQAPTGGPSDVFLVEIGAYDTPTNVVINDLKDAIDAGNAIIGYSSYYPYNYLLKGEYDASSVTLTWLIITPNADGNVYKLVVNKMVAVYSGGSWLTTTHIGRYYTVPVFGSTGQALVKHSDTDGDTEWKSLAASDVGAIPAPASPNDGDVLTYDSGTTSWVAAAPGAASSDVYIIDLDSSYLPTCTGPDVVAAFTAGQVLLCRKQGVSGLDYYSVEDFEDYGSGNCEVRLISLSINTVSHTISATRHTLFYDAVDEDWTHTSATETIDVDDVITKPASPTNGQYLMWNGSSWVAQTLPVYDGS